MKQELYYDVVVVGAGPAGSRAARDIARAGFRVALLEEHLQVGRPVTCAGLITPRALELASVSPKVVVRSITSARVHSLSGRELELEGSSIQAVVIDRALLDQELAAQAQEAGAELLLGAKVVGLERRDRAVQIWAEMRGQAMSLEARLVVGADGPGSVVARSLGISPPDETISCVSAEVQLRAEPAQAVHVFMNSHLAPGWFAWAIPAQDGWARLGLGTADGGSPRLLLQRLVEAYPQLFQGLNVGRLVGGRIGLGLAGSLYSDNTLIVGGAAGQVKPTSGGGIYLGLRAAALCARAAIDSLRKDDLSASSLARYTTLWEEELGPEFQRSLDLRRAFKSLNDEDIESILAVLRRPSFQRLIAGYGDIDFPSRLFSRFLKVAPLASGLIHLPLSLWPRALSLAWRWRGLV